MIDDTNNAMVNRCECKNKTFAQLHQLGSLEAAIKAGAGVECEGCMPWLKLSFASGETELALDDSRLKDYE